MGKMLLLLMCALGALAEEQESFNTTPPPVSSSFSCSGRPMGYYADLESNCRAYHTCDDHGNHFSHHCPEDTAFRQDAMICDHAYLVDCRANIEGAGLAARLGQDASHDAAPSDFVEPRGEGSNARGFARSFRISQKESPGSKYPTFVLNSSVFLKNRDEKRPSTPVRSRESESESTKTRVTQKDYKDNSVPTYQAQEASSRSKDDSELNYRPHESSQRNSQVTSPGFRVQEAFQKTDSASSFRAPETSSRSASASTPSFRPAQQSTSSDKRVTSPSFQPARQTSSSDTRVTAPSFQPARQTSTSDTRVTAPAFQVSSTRSKDDSSTRTQENSNVVAAPKIRLSEDLEPPLEPSKQSKTYSSYAQDYEFSFLQPPAVRDDNEYYMKNSFESLKNRPEKSEPPLTSEASFESVSFSPRTKLVLGLMKARNLGRDFPMMPIKPVNFLEPPPFKSDGFSRSSFNFRTDDYPYVETLRSIQGSKTTTTTETSILALPAKSLGSAAELDNDPYYPRTPTSTEAYYTPRQQPRRPLFTTTRKPSGSSAKFEIPAVLPDLNSLEDLLDRRKFFFIPQMKSV